jgi:lipopolysaccharide transport system permease protein
VLGASVDFFVAYGLLFFLQFYYGVFTLKQFLYVPLIFSGVFMFGFGCALILSALNSKFRDVTHVIPLLTQLWIFATPIMYPLQIVPEKFLWFYSLNPMVGYVEAFRWATTTTVPFPPLLCLIPAVLGTLTAFALGVFLFRRWSGTLVDML